MAHQFVNDANGKTPFAYVGEKAWHGLGQQLTPNSPIPVWIEEAGFNYDILDTPVCGILPSSEAHVSDEIITLPNRRLLYRSDTRAALSVVSDSYKIVQPREVLEFYEDLVETAGFQLETAGILFGGKRMFALAKTAEGQEVVDGDEVKGYLLLSTSCDGSLATSARFTSIRVVCNNTLTMAVRNTAGEDQKKIVIPHSREFNASAVKEQLGLAESSYGQFIADMRKLARRKLTKREEIDALIRIYGDPTKSLEDQLPGPANLMKDAYKLYTGEGMGSDMCRGTAWGLLNAVTELADHHTGHKTPDARMDSAWFGQNAKLKEAARDELLLMAL